MDVGFLVVFGFCIWVGVAFVGVWISSGWSIQHIRQQTAYQNHGVVENLMAWREFDVWHGDGQ